MNRLWIVLALLLAVSSASASRNLVVVNSTGETADWVALDDSATDLAVATLGLTPNDFLVQGATGVAINSGSSDLYLYELPGMSSTGSIFLGNGRNPYKGAWLSDDTLIITNWLTSTISRVSISGGNLVSEHNVGVPASNINHPQGIAIVGRKAYIAMSCFNEEYVYFPGKIEVYDFDLDSTTTRIDVGLNAQTIMKGHDGYLYVVCTGDYWDVFGMLYRIDPATDMVLDSLEIGGQPGDIAITREGLAYLAAGGWGGWSGRETKPPSAWLRGHGSALSPADDGGFVYTVDLQSWTVLHGPGDPLMTDFGVVAVLAVSDTSVVTCNYQDDTITEMDSSGTVLARFYTGDGPTALAKYPGCFRPVGDVDDNGLVNISDAVNLIAYIFAGGTPPVNSDAGDADGNSIVNISDAVTLIAYIFGGGYLAAGCAD